MYKNEIVSLCRELRLCSLLGDNEAIQADGHDEVNKGLGCGKIKLPKS